MVDSKISIKSQYWHICWPASLEGLLIIMLSSVDLLMVSSLGTEAVAAVGLFSQPKMAILCICRSLSVAVTAIVAHMYGGDKWKEITPFLKQATMLATIASLGLFLLSQFWMSEILWLAGVNAEYYSEAISYARLANISLLFFGPALVITGGLTGVGNTRAMLLANVAGNITNVLLNGTFIYLLGWGVAGAGTATAIGGVVTLLCAFQFARKPDYIINMRGLEGWNLTKANILKIKEYFSGIFIEQGSERIGMFIYYHLAAMLGTVEFAIHNICMTLCDIFYSFAQGFSKASLALAGMLHLRGNKEEQHKLYHVALQIPLMAATVFAVLYIVFAKDLISLYSSDLRLVEMGTNILIIVGICSFPSALSLSMSGVLRGGGLTTYVAKYSFLSISIVRPIVTYMLSFYFGLGLYGAWFALALDQTTRWICAHYQAKKVLRT